MSYSKIEKKSFFFPTLVAQILHLGVAHNNVQNIFSPTFEMFLLTRLYWPIT